MHNLFLAFRQVKYENKSFWRNPAAAFFTFVLPLTFLVIFNLLLGDNDFQVSGGVTRTSYFYIPGIITLSVVSACYTNISIGICISRDRGLLKRIKGTPLPSWVFLFGRIVNAIFITLLLVILVVLIGAIFFDVGLPRSTLPALLVTLMLGAITFCSLGVAVTTLVPNGDAAPAAINASVLPLLFVSDVFIPITDGPGWLGIITHIFPIKPFSTALQTVFNPFESGMGFEFADLGIMLLWAVFGVAIAIRYFSWESRG